MSSHPLLRVGTFALAYVLTVPAFAQIPLTEPDFLTGDIRLACEAVLCLSTSHRPGECSPALERYFGIKKYKKHRLDWNATIDARRGFLRMCPASNEEGLPARIDAISRGAGKCDPDYLNNVFASTSYKWRQRKRVVRSMFESNLESLEVYQIKTVKVNKLPAYCVSYTEHEWTYQLGMKYVGDPLMGGYWVKSEDYDAAQAKWDAEHSGAWASGWNFSFTDPRKDHSTSNNR